ncbi:MAG TPA: hypothetical protein VFV05_09865, partial [Methylomirabilota bacterium]|nr:hypothetical protein [Methylomirabilota bacterium]
GHVYAASQDAGRVYIVDTGTNTVGGSVAVSDGPAAFGLFIGPQATACDTTALEQELAAAQRQVAALQAANQALSSANQALITENERLRAELKAAQTLVDSFVYRLFGHPADGNVAAAARAVALAALTDARAKVPGDRRLRVAQQSFDQGEAAMRRSEWGRAVHEFRETYEMAERILGERYSHKHRR